MSPAITEEFITSFKFDSENPAMPGTSDNPYYADLGQTMLNALDILLNCYPDFPGHYEINNINLKYPSPSNPPDYLIQLWLNQDWEEQQSLEIFNEFIQIITAAGFLAQPVSGI